MKFTKMHGLGNDYVYINQMIENIENPSEVSIQVSDRHFGIGSDGLIMICESEVADFRMRMFNADGSEAEMCGNGIRCVGKYIYDNGLTDKKSVTIETLAGIKKLDFTIEDAKVMLVRVNMGKAILKADDVPVISKNNKVIDEKIIVNGEEYNITAISMGNPHAVIFVDCVEEIDIEKVGPPIEHADIFPNKINVEFIEVVDRENVKMRVWERGSGETLACGTGACASAVACVLNGKTERKVNVELLGGMLTIEYEEDGTVYMTGPATTVFEGEWV